MSTWYWKNAQHAEPQGPVSPRDLKGLALNNVLNRSDLVWKEGMAEWVEAHKLKGLFDGVARAPQRRPENTVEPASPPRSSSPRVHHSTGMYRKNEQQEANFSSAGAPSFGSASIGGASIGGPSSMNQPFKGVDYEELPSFFSHRGRMRRTTYFLQSLGISVALAIVMIVAMLLTGSLASPEAINSPGLSLFIIVLSIGGAVLLSFPFVKRLHDLNMSGWFYWVNFIPLVSALFSLYVLFAPGSDGPNKYGPNPR